MADDPFPDAVQVVDPLHAEQHLRHVGKAACGAESPEAGRWAEARHDELDDGRFEVLFAAVRVHARTHDAARLCGDRLERNRHRMHYPELRKAGLRVPTGVVEAGCKTAAQGCLERGGMRWSVRGANAILALRRCRLSGRFEDYWERRSTRAVA